MGEEGWLIFTCSLMRWRRLRRTDRVLEHMRAKRKIIVSLKINQSYFQEGKKQKELSLIEVYHKV